MATDPRHLKPSELLRLVNSTPLGEVIGSSSFYRLRQRAGLNASDDGKTIHLLKFARWLALNALPAAVPTATNPTRMAGESHREQMARRSRAQSDAVAEIGPIPPVVNPERREAGRLDPVVFAEEYFSHVPYGCFMPMADAHREIYADFDQVCTYGGQSLLVASRSGGKTTSLIISLCRAICYALIRSGLYGCETMDLGKERLSLIKTIFETNDKLADDFPELCYPIRKLERKVQRCDSQTCQGEHTRMVWRADKIGFPYIYGPDGKPLPTSGTKLAVFGMKTGVRGILDDIGRPDMVVIDDPQGDEAAESERQRDKNRKLIEKTFGQLGSIYLNLSMLMVATPIEEGDVIDEYADREKHPEWMARRYPFLSANPLETSPKFSEQYIAMRRDDMRGGDRYARRAHAFFLKHRKAIEKGIACHFPHAYAGGHVILPGYDTSPNVLPDGSEIESSPVEKALNILGKQRGDVVFQNEFQVQPLPADTDSVQLDVAELRKRRNGYKRRAIPLDVQRLTAFVDVQGELLFWLVAGWTDRFGGHVIDYGTFPKQPGQRYTLASVKKTLSKAFPGTALEGRLYAGLESVTGDLLGRVYTREDGADLRIDKLLVDANWGQSTDVVYQFCRQSEHAARLTPSHGKYYGAKGQPFGQTKKQKGEQRGLHWRMPSVKGRRQTRYVVYDTNFWKSFIADHLQTPLGEPGALQFFGRRAQADSGLHDLLIDHLTAERCTKVTANDRTADEWDLPQKSRDNHWWDCLTGAAVAASMSGTTTKEHGQGKAPKRRKRKTVSIKRAGKGR